MFRVHNLTPSLRSRKMILVMNDTDISILYIIYFRSPFMFILVINFSAMTRVILYDLIIYDFKNNFYEPITIFFSEHNIILKPIPTT